MCFWRTVKKNFSTNFRTTKRRSNQKNHVSVDRPRILIKSSSFHQKIWKQNLHEEEDSPDGNLFRFCRQRSFSYLNFIDRQPDFFSCLAKQYSIREQEFILYFFYWKLPKYFRPNILLHKFEFFMRTLKDGTHVFRHVVLEVVQSPFLDYMRNDFYCFSL